ncbi:propanediol/glycerol family dehydratase medium subunit [Haladaptatus caseinilyticus]|uniref:propanediol/glycerol family dehydratase medium subunit n=1 Tax=Haladaptatus caseinilyticus TaxID=2993314 RepID=UPI00224B5EE3|nr:propanediol/glycerol family dehydratase medium subunit [Haladaptatus caseinilyticus]
MSTKTEISRRKLQLEEKGIAEKGSESDEVVIAISPAFGETQTSTIVDIPLANVLRETMAGIEEEGLKSRLVRFIDTADLGNLGNRGAELSGSGISVGIQSKGTALIHQADLLPLSNLELFPQAPLLDREKFRAIGKNAAKYAKGENPSPVTVENDPMARPKYQALAAVLHIKESKSIDESREPVELEAHFE